MPLPIGGILIGSAIAQGLGGLLAGNSASKQAEKDRREATRQFDLTRQDNLRRDQVGASQFDPLAQQKSRGNMALMAAILPQLRNYSFSAPEGMQQYVPKATGGFKIPDGGFDPQTLNFFSQRSRAGAESDFLRTLGIPEATITRLLGNVGYQGSAVSSLTPTPPDPAQGLTGSRTPTSRSR